MALLRHNKLADGLPLSGEDRSCSGHHRFHAAVGGFRGGMGGGGFRGGTVGAFTPRFNRVAFARFHRFGHRRFAFAAVPFGVGVGLYGGSCWSWQPTPWGWQRVWACDYDYGYYY